MAMASGVAPIPTDEGGSMPVHRGKDSKGPFYQWGGEGKKYHYTSGNKSSRDAAKKKDWAKPTSPRIVAPKNGHPSAIQ